ncbi:MAG: hypothetical protein IMZ64_05775, partial [Bacteroidetes bacterium]|nr:hypothetical protein [Bacteroidota bacterium]
GIRHKCKWCSQLFDEREVLEKHKEDIHGDFSKEKHNGVINGEDKKPFNPQEILKRYRNEVSEVISFPKAYEPNDKAIPEKNRIYSPNKKFWCAKSTKVQAEACYSAIKEMNERLKTRGTGFVEPDVQDLVSISRMKNGKREIFVFYIWDTNSRTYRIFTDEVKGKKLSELVFDKDCFMVKGKSRPKLDIPVGKGKYIYVKEIRGRSIK